MNRFREVEGRRLLQLTINSQASIKALREKLDKAERILKLAEVTRKLETEREKVGRRGVTVLGRPAGVNKLERERERAGTEAYRGKGAARDGEGARRDISPPARHTPREMHFLFTTQLPPPPVQVLPFYESSVAEEEKAASGAAELVKSLQTSAGGRDGGAVEEWEYLSGFFKRYNKVRRAQNSPRQPRPTW